MKCKYNDCGWYYRQTEKSNDDAGQCNNAKECEEYKEQEVETNG